MSFLATDDLHRQYFEPHVTSANKREIRIPCFSPNMLHYDVLTSVDIDPYFWAANVQVGRSRQVEALTYEP